MGRAVFEHGDQATETADFTLEYSVLLCESDLEFVLASAHIFYLSLEFAVCILERRVLAPERCMLLYQGRMRALQGEQ